MVLACDPHRCLRPRLHTPPCSHGTLHPDFPQIFISWSFSPFKKGLIKIQPYLEVSPASSPEMQLTTKVPPFCVTLSPEPQSKGLVGLNQEGVCRKVLNITRRISPKDCCFYFYYLHKSSIFKYTDTSYQASKPWDVCDPSLIMQSPGPHSPFRYWWEAGLRGQAEYGKVAGADRPVTASSFQAVSALPCSWTATRNTGHPKRSGTLRPASRSRNQPPRLYSQAPQQRATEARWPRGPSFPLSSLIVYSSYARYWRLLGRVSTC